ncbi:MAG: hypothetical protein HBSAPP02_18700 [Phycisphaerae bacterium]|nr:MAG: hypothetical protein HBSAPP02_18700 [Phycisphaerae bacterium]
MVSSDKPLDPPQAGGPYCDRCRESARPGAMYCPRCGEPLGLAGMTASATAPAPSSEAPGAKGSSWRACDNAADVQYRWGSAWGGQRLLGTENIEVAIINRGRPLRSVVLEIRGRSPNGLPPVRMFQEIEELPRNREVRFELASYEMPDEIEELNLSIVSSTAVE